MLLFLNDVAGSEILLILAFVLMFFGSKSIPGIARTMGRTMRQIKDATQEVQNEIKKSGADIRKDLNVRSMVNDTVNDIRQPLDQYADDINEALRPDAKPYVRPSPIEPQENKVAPPSEKEPNTIPDPESTNSESKDNAL
ncbi:MAG: twin-arginine translocase TatA/TatE family subunit [Crocinitomicaceae bacterium]|jgi:sec-independent protein translocase protein TatA|nr:twin-arginine translocase TatA/TatE family subunit [Crocinitomicaceae bacterium]